MQAHSCPLQTHTRLQIYPPWKNINPALSFFFSALSIVLGIWPPKHFTQPHVLKNHNQWSLLLLEKIPRQLPAAQITAVGPGVNVSSTAHGSRIPAEPAHPEHHMGREATKITTFNGMKNIPNEGWILGKMSALTQIILAFLNSRG